MSRCRVPLRPTLAAALALACALAACGSERASAPGEVSPGEARALEDAASMLDERKLPPEAIPTDAPSAAPSAAPAEMTGDTAPAQP
ncbi:hypothetical protein ACLBKU_05055 [Erythrobacter sp. NE805]|uniref:hypothetical protein n=1 Tax=Erythrobacter sp. NE805 TaxID=3389875 RepID=UPI00396B135D